MTLFQITDVVKVGSYRFDWYLGPPLFAKPRDTITWTPHQMRSPAIIFHTMQPSGLIKYLILFIKYEPSIVSKNEKQHRVAEKISDFFVQKKVLSIFFLIFAKFSVKPIITLSLLYI